jgi:hypothetical protein
MAERLETITRTLDPLKNPFLNTERVRVVREALARTDDPERRTRLTVALAEELLKTGSAEQAIAMMQPFLEARGRALPGAPPVERTRRFLALASYRMGIQQNCGARPNAARCILPLGRDGIHESPRGTRAALALWAGLLKDDPDDLAARWLYNIGAMTVGDYPGGVPRAWLIPEEVFAPETPFPVFRNVAPIAGLDAENHAGGALMEDFDGDGLLDVMVSSMQPSDQLRLFRNDGDGRFTEVTEAAGLRGETGGLNLVHADYDNDGDPDVLLLRGGWMRLGGRYPKSLLRNDGGMSFEDVTEEAGLLTLHPTQTAAWGDYDGDGWLDLMVGNESAPPFDPHPSELFRNNGDGTFSDRSFNLGESELGYVKGVVWGDYDNDGRQDLFVSVLGWDNQLLRNEGPRAVPGPGGQDWVFTDVTDRAGVREPLDSFAAWFWDYDNDGWLDLLVDGYLPTEVADFALMYLGRPTRTPMPRLYRNNRDGTFADVSRATRIDRVALPMGANFGDLDNDGWPDAYFGTGQPNLDAVLPNRLFRNDGGRVFQDVTLAARVGHLQKGHGIAFGDIDNDGDQDLFAQMGGFYDCDVARNVLFENPGGGGGSITLRLQGRRANRSAIGARIRVRVVTPRGPRDLFALAGTGGSFGGNSLQQEIGLGDATAVMEIEIRWPGSDRVQTFRGAGPAGVYRIVEGREALEPVEVRSFRFPAPERSAATRSSIER